MGNDASSQAGMIAAKAKMSGALSSVEETLNLKSKENNRKMPKTSQRDWANMHNETAEVWVAMNCKVTRKGIISNFFAQSSAESATS